MSRRAERPALRRLTIHAAPPALVLRTPTSSDPQSIDLEWSRAPQGAPFGSYKVFRADAPGVADSPARRLVEEIGERGSDHGHRCRRRAWTRLLLHRGAGRSAGRRDPEQ